MATLDDILTTQKNGVIAINNLSQIFKSYNEGVYTSATVTSQTIIITGSGRLVSFSVTVAGTVNGTINNAASVAKNAASNALVATPTTVGVYHCGMRFTQGLIINPGTGQSINITYSTD